MAIEHLVEKFARIGARMKLNAWRPEEMRRTVPELRMDVQRDDRGEYFDIRVESRAIEALQVVDTQPRMRHLLLRANARATRHGRQTFLCGHDERHWFVAAIPERARATSVEGAMESLKPAVVLAEQWRTKIRRSQRLKRHNAAYIRQGEWFFIPRPELKFDTTQILHGERLSRGTGSKPHVVDELVRFGGLLVYVSDVAPAGLTEDQYTRWWKRNPKSTVKWTTMQRGARAYVRGCVRHDDHDTIRLDLWHEVAMNTENEARAMRHVAFLD